MTLPIKARGEISVKLGDQDFVLEPSFKRIAKLEAALGRSLVQLAVELGRSKNLSFMDVALIVHTMAKTPKLSMDEIGELVVAHGLVNALPALQGLFERVLSGEGSSGPEGNDAPGESSG